jgi:hypothetical protein
MRIRLPLLILLALAALPAAASALDLNGYRAAHGRKALRANATLAAMAQAHAADLARRGTLDHAGFTSGRARASGATAENVSYGCGNQSCAILQWSQSAPHRANMLRADVTSYGLASAVSSSGERYWVLELGHDFAGAGGMSRAAAKKPGALRGAYGIEIREGVGDERP